MIIFSFSNWRIEDIKGIDVKRNEELENEDEDEEEISQGLTSDELFGINSAMFKGNSIRDSGIVKKFEDQGFYFTSMKIKYSYKKATESFIVDINFKGTENVKIDIISTYDNVENRDLKVVLSMDEQEKIIQEFQIAVNKIFANLIKNQTKH